MNRAYEVQAVKELGERIGYGNMMDIASALWANNLLEEWNIPAESTGAFVPVCLFQLKKRDRKRAFARLESMMNHVKQTR